MTEEQIAAALAVSDPAGPQGPSDDPAENRELWDWGGGSGQRAALANDGRLIVQADGQAVALTPQAWAALAAYARAALGV